MVKAKRHTFKEGSSRKDQWVWYDLEGDWRVCVADQGITNPNRFNVILGTDVYESRHVDGKYLADTRIHSEVVFGYEKAMARAAELMREAENIIDEEQ